MSRTVLCVDSSDRVKDLAEIVSQNDDTTVKSVTTVDDATDILKNEPIMCVVTAYRFDGDDNGLAVAEALRTYASQTPVVVYSDVSVGNIDTDGFSELVVEFLDRTRDGAADRLQYLVDDLINHSVQAQVGFLTPSDEQDRLEAIEQYELEDLPVQETFDRVTSLIADHFDAAVAFIGLVEREEERFLACEGGDLSPVTREDTMCTHSIMEERVMTVEDVKNDKRFSENELLNQLGVRAYAGANLTTPDGHTIGAVCVLDTEPREFTDNMCEQLQAYADTVMEVLELRQQVADSDTAEHPEVAQ